MRLKLVKEVRFQELMHLVVDAKRHCALMKVKPAETCMLDLEKKALFQ